jgi:hypothetical protein
VVSIWPKDAFFALMEHRRAKLKIVHRRDTKHVDKRQMDEENLLLLQKEMQEIVSMIEDGMTSGTPQTTIGS